MADFFKLIGGEQPAVAPLAVMLQGIGFDLREVDAGTSAFNIFAKEVIRAGHPTTQEPTALDTPIQILFGDAQTGDGWELDALGAFLNTRAGQYTFRVNLQIGRTDVPQIAIVFVRFMLNGVQFGDPVFTKLATPNDQIPTTFGAVVDIAVGDIVTVEIMRDSAGVNDGGIYAATCSIPAWGTAQSCVMVISENFITEPPQIP